MPRSDACSLLTHSGAIDAAASNGQGVIYFELSKLEDVNG